MVYCFPIFFGGVVVNFSQYLSTGKDYIQSMLKMTITCQLFDNLRLMWMTINVTNTKCQQDDPIMIFYTNQIIILLCLVRLS